MNQTPNAIGYAEVFGSLVADPDVSVLYIDNAAPTAANVRNGSYKFWTGEHLYTSAITASQGTACGRCTPS